VGWCFSAGFRFANVQPLRRVGARAGVRIVASRRLRDVVEKGEKSILGVTRSLSDALPMSMRAACSAARNQWLRAALHAVSFSYLPVVLEIPIYATIYSVLCAAPGLKPIWLPSICLAPPAPN
jgi:hypothetical protein